MRPHQSRVGAAGLSVTCKLALKADVELTMKRGENLLSRGKDSMCKGKTFGLVRNQRKRPELQHHGGRRGRGR